VIWKRQPQGGHPQTIKDATGFDVTIGLRIPLRQDDDRSSRLVLPLFLWREQSGPHDVVFSRWCRDCARPGQLIAGKFVIIDLR
jgi:hypothetical protein